MSNALTWTATYTKEAVLPTAHASEVIEPETIEQKIDRIALAHGIATTTLYNLVQSESNFDPNADNGEDRGIAQINRKSFPEITDEQAFDPEFSLNFAAQKISEGKDYLWTVCSCVQLVKSLGVNIKGNADDIFPTDTVIPHAKGVVILKYWNPDRHHVAYIESVEKDGLHIIEGNFERCKITRRVIPLNDIHIMGYYKPLD